MIEDPEPGMGDDDGRQDWDRGGGVGVVDLVV